MNRKSRVFKPTVLAGAIASLSMTGATGVSAEEFLLEEIIVTAQKRSEGLQDVPISITAMSGEKINDAGITSLQELTQYTPNVTVNAGAGTPNLFIRGIGSGTNQGFEQSVGMYIDGVYAGRGPLAAVPTTMDLQRVEILKGPQGILFGKNTIAGAINVTSAKPTDEFEGMAEVLYAPDHGQQQYNIVLSGPLTDDLSGRLAVRHDTFDGWWDNVTNGDVGPDQDNWYARGSLRWVINDDLEINAKYEHGNFQADASPSAVYQSDIAGQATAFGPAPLPVISDGNKGAGEAGTTKDTNTDVIAVQVDWNLDFATFTSISSYSTYDLKSFGDTDTAAVPAITRTRWEDYEQYSQELRLVSPGGETIDWIAGVYYQQNELDISRRLDELDFTLMGDLSAAPLYSAEPGTPTVFDQEGESWAVFGQATWNATEDLRLTLGLRYNEETKELDKISDSAGLQIKTLGGNFYSDPTKAPSEWYSIADLRSHSFTDLDRKEDKWTYSANVQWDVSDDTMVYASVSTGYKGGGYDEAYSGSGAEVRIVHPVTNAEIAAPVEGNDASILEYEPEEVTSYEVGAKMSLLDGAAEVNVALFRSEYENLQTSSLVGDAFRVGNAGEAISQGVEVDGRMRLSERLTVGGALAYLDARYEEFNGATCTIPQAEDPVNNPGCLLEDGTNIASSAETGGQNLKDETLVYSPEWSANLFARYVMPLGSTMELTSTVDINYTDEFYSALDLDPNTEHDASTRINARIALVSTDGTWEVALLGKNLTDEKTYFWKNDVAVTDSNSYWGAPERPRSFALQGRYNF
jgi:iron complex outermembrane recepter protein